MEKRVFQQIERAKMVKLDYFIRGELNLAISFLFNSSTECSNFALLLMVLP